MLTCNLNQARKEKLIPPPPPAWGGGETTHWQRCQLFSVRRNILLLDTPLFRRLIFALQVLSTRFSSTHYNQVLTTVIRSCMRNLNLHHFSSRHQTYLQHDHPLPSKKNLQSCKAILLLEPCISLIYAWKPTNIPIIHSIYYVYMIAPTYFGITLPSSGMVPRAFLDMLNWGTVDKILWMGVLFLVTWCLVITTHHATRHNILSTAPQLSISQKTVGTLPEDGNVMPKHIGDTLYN
jgi:hypothetical protein